MSPGIDGLPIIYVPLFVPIWNRSKLNEASRRTLIPIIDASKTGNLGRFFNHACSPNIGIQNVFTNHHDIRYPHTSFFTLRNIKAGEELCWHYGYENKMTQECHCGTNACNGYYRWLHFTLQHVSLPQFIFARQYTHTILSKVFLIKNMFDLKTKIRQN